VATSFPVRGQKAPNYWDAQLKGYIDERVTPETVEENLPERLSEDALSETYASIERAKPVGLQPDPVIQHAARNIVMTTPPTVTEGSAATLTAQVVNMLTDTRLQWSGVTTLSTDAGSILIRGPRRTDGSFDAGTANHWSTVEFMFDGAALEFRILGFSNKYVLTVDGERHTATNGALAAGGASRYLKFDFGGRRSDGLPRRIVLSCDQAFWKELRVGAADTIYPVVPVPVLAILGDSYATGFATRAMVSTYDAYPQRLARLLGMRVNTQNAASTTGFINTNGATAGTYLSRVPDIIALNPEVVFVQASINDYTYTPAAVGDAASAVFAALRAGLPDAVLITGGILDARVQAQQGTDAAQNTAIEAAALANGFYYLDIQPGWVTGNGYAGATTGAGNSDVYTYSDQTHPTTAGGLYLATRVAALMKSMVPALT
jgi:hypothetical protein